MDESALNVNEASNLAPQDDKVESAASLVCYDVSSGSDSEMELSKDLQIKVEPVDTTEVVPVDVEITNGSSSIIMNDNSLLPSIVNSKPDVNLNDGQNALSNDIDKVPVPVVVQNCDSEQNSIVIISNDKTNYRHQEEINISSDSEPDSPSSAESSSSSDESEKEEVEELVIKQPAKKTTKKKAKDPFSEDILLPPIEDLQISIKEEEAKPIGFIFQIVDNQVVVQAYPDIPPIDLDSVLFLDSGKRALGKVFDVFGSIQEPLYVVRFNTAEHVKEKSVERGLKVYFAPQSNQHTSYVIMDKLIGKKGSDASWRDNEEPPPSHIDYSDDEEERRAKHAWKQTRMVQKDSFSTSSEDIVHVEVEIENFPKKIKDNSYNNTRQPRQYVQNNKSQNYQRNQFENKNFSNSRPPQYCSRTPDQVVYRGRTQWRSQPTRPIMFGGPPQFPLPSHSPFLRPPPSPVLRNTHPQSPGLPFHHSSPGPPQNWSPSVSPLPTVPPPPQSTSTFRRNASQDPPSVFQGPPPPLLRGNGQPPTSYVSQSAPHLHSQIHPTTLAHLGPPPMYSQGTPVTIMSHTAHPPPSFHSMRPSAAIQPPQGPSPPMSVGHQILHPAQSYVSTQEPPRSMRPMLRPMLSSSPSVVLPQPHCSSPFLIQRRTPSPHLQQQQQLGPPPPFMQFQRPPPPQHVAVLGPSHMHSSPNMHFQNNTMAVAAHVPSQAQSPPVSYHVPPPHMILHNPVTMSSHGSSQALSPVNYNVPPPHIILTSGPRPQLSPSSCPPQNGMQVPPPNNYSAHSHFYNRTFE